LAKFTWTRINLCKYSNDTELKDSLLDEVCTLLINVVEVKLHAEY